MASETDGAAGKEDMTGQNQCVVFMSIFLKCNFKSIFNYISAEIRTHPIMIFLNIARRAISKIRSSSWNKNYNNIPKIAWLKIAWIKIKLLKKIEFKLAFEFG